MTSSPPGDGTTRWLEAELAEHGERCTYIDPQRRKVCGGCDTHHEWPCPTERLRRAVEAVLHWHVKDKTYPMCPTCRAIYPCETVLAISGALGGGGTTTEEEGT